MHHLQSLSALYLEPFITKGVVYTLVDKVGSHVVYSFRIFFFFGWLVGCFVCTQGMQKFLGQGSNLRHSCDLNCYSDNIGPLTHCGTRELQALGFFF